MNDKKHRIIIRTLNGIFYGAVFTVLLAFLSFSIYSIWDDARIINAVNNVRDEMIKLKPQIDEDGKPDFSELRKINPDVIGWITLGNTSIDYPVLKGEDNLAYITTDVYGKYAVAGSIFLDSRCSSDFTDRISLIYGHHMANGSMFGDLDKYKSEEFFRRNYSGNYLITTEGIFSLETIALVETDSYNSVYYFDEAGPDQISSALYRDLKYINEAYTEKEFTDDMRFLILSTCSDEFTDARTILILEIKEDE